MALTLRAGAGVAVLPSRRAARGALRSSPSRPMVRANRSQSQKAARKVAVSASDDENMPPRLTRENEPESAWLTEAEKKGANPMSDPLAILGVFAILIPFILLGIAFAAGLIDVP